MIHSPLHPKNSPTVDMSAPQFTTYSQSSSEQLTPKYTSIPVQIIPRKACKNFIKNWWYLGNECRRNHKRCDKKLPSCTRCTSRGCLCVYSERKKPGKITKQKKMITKIQQKIESAPNVEIKSENYVEPNQPPEDD